MLELGKKENYPASADRDTRAGLSVGAPYQRPHLQGKQDPKFRHIYNEYNFGSHHMRNRYFAFKLDLVFACSSYLRADYGNDCFRKKE